MGSYSAAGFFPSPVHSELLKSVVIPCMTVNLGLQLSTAQSHFACFSSVSRRSPRLFSSFHTRSARQSIELLSSHPKSHRACPRGKFEMMNTKKKSHVCLNLLYIIHLNLNSGQGALHRGYKRDGCFSFPSCTSNTTQIGTEGWIVSAGISILSPAPTPSKANLPGASTQHNTPPWTSQT